ncbi:MAG: T9SS type A sorting domain-containing protein, partial [Flavobacteriaceae bacterium]
SDSDTTVNSVVDNFTINITNSDGTADTSTGSPKGLVGKKLGVWIQEENIYLTLTFNSWISGQGGFSYTRSTEGSLSIDNPETSSKIILAPNPVKDRVYVYGVNNPTAYHIYNLLGREVAHGRVSDGGAVEVALLPRGLYLLKFQNGNAIKFVKE